MEKIEVTVIPRVVFALAVWLAAVTHANAAPARCSYGYQDSSCTSPIQNAPVPQPQCQSGAGWTTVVASVWQGSRWSTPQCSYQPAPTCPPNYTQTSSPTWTGSSWADLQCTPSTPPALTDSDLALICSRYAVSMGFNLDPIMRGEPFYRTGDDQIFIARDRTRGGDFTAQAAVGPARDSYPTLCLSEGRPQAVTQCRITSTGTVIWWGSSYGTCSDQGG